MADTAETQEDSPIWNLRMRQGSSRTFLATWRDKITKIGHDLTGRRVVLHVRVQPRSVETLLELSTDDDSIELLAQSGDTLGKFELHFGGVALAAVAAGTWTYDCFVDPGEDNGKCLFRGAFIVSARDTR